MKKGIILSCFFVVLICAYGGVSFFFKQKTVSFLKTDAKRIQEFKSWGLDTTSFEIMYAGLVQEAQSIPFYFLPFQSQYLTNKHDKILLLTQSNYATEMSRQKVSVQTRLSYLRDRIKTNTILSSPRKQSYSDSFEVIAGTIFEKETDIKGLISALLSLAEADYAITNEVELIRKESLMSELNLYKATCQELVSYFIEKDCISNQSLAQECINSADLLMTSNNRAADYIETQSRERVFALVQKTQQAKQQLIQDEQYMLAVKLKEEERLTVVPPAPRQEGKIVVVNLGLQRLYAYENGKSIFDTAVTITTGKQGFETVTGEFAIYLKEQQHKMVSPFPGIYYDDVVNYWMPFYLGYGLHDAPWRAVYGTQDYPVVGSHGCVNMPLKDTIVLYNWAEVGTRVLVL